MKCSLLTLSTFIDGELAPQRRSEVDAHLIGCARCSAGAATLREEKARVGQLARVTVDAGSAQLMLEQVGIVVDPGVEHSPAVPPPPSPPDDEHRPWQRSASSAALPWTPRRPDRMAALPDGEALSPDLQPDLPLEGVRAVPPSWDWAPADDAMSQASAWADPGAEWHDNAAVPDSWEAELPPPAEPRPEHVTTWVASTPPPPAEPPTPPALPVMSSAPTPASPPTRVVAASGPSALWTRLHDAVTVRLALARGGDALDDSAQIVSGAPARRGMPLPVQDLPATAVVTDSPAAPDAPPHGPPDIELSGLGEARTRAVAVDAPASPPVVDVQPKVSPHTPDEQPAEAPSESAGWNAFAASSYPDPDMPVAQPPADRQPRPLGRHSRAVARDQVTLADRFGRAVTTAAGAVRAGGGAATTRVRQAAGRAGKAGPDNRLLAGVAAIGLIFVIALLVGHVSSRPSTPVATHPVATAAAQPHQSTPAQSSAAAASGADAATAVQTFGAGDRGFQVVRLRYGAQTSYMRVVFDLGAAHGAVTGTPRVTVSFTTPTTMVVTLEGTLPAGSTGTPTPGKVISSVSLLSSSGGKTVYRFGLTRAATATAFYLASPTRFVLDIH